MSLPTLDGLTPEQLRDIAKRAITSAEQQEKAAAAEREKDRYIQSGIHRYDTETGTIECNWGMNAHDAWGRSTHTSDSLTGFFKEVLQHGKAGDLKNLIGILAECAARGDKKNRGH